MVMSQSWGQRTAPSLRSKAIPNFATLPNFTGKDNTSLGMSAKSISQEIGGSFFEFLETTLNRLVKGVKVLGEDDAKDTNVDNIELPDEEDENQIDLDI